MLGSSHERTLQSDGSVYGRNTDAGPHPGEQTTCELCETQTRCFDRYGMVACRSCQRELLPAVGLL